MTIPRTGSRQVVVDGVAYRWRVRSRPTYDQALAQSGLTVAIQISDGSGRALHLRIPAARVDNWLHAPGYVVMPRDIERWIRFAISQGWVPTANGPPLSVQVPADQLETDRVELV
jgi:hypothetical protein